MEQLRWELKWSLENHEEAHFDPITLEAGEVLTWEFDSVVNPSDPELTFNELLWEADLDKADDKRNLYSFPTARTLVPMYDLEVETLSSILAVNAWLGQGDKINPKSEHWKKHK